MKRKTNNPQVARWAKDPAQKEKFLTEVGPRIDGESRHIPQRYGVGTYQEDIASEIRLELWQQIREKDADGPFAKDAPFAKASPKAAADFLGANFRIRERVRSLARKEARKQSRQAEILADVRQPDLPPDVETQLFDIAKSLPRITSGTPDLTPRESDIVRKEVLRQVGIDDLSGSSFDQVAKAAGVSSSEQRAYNEYHEKKGQNSASDRKAWSRASGKVRKAFSYDKETKDFDREKFTSLLVIVFALSLALLSAFHQDRSIHQNAFVNQDRFIHLAQQVNRIHQTALAHQVNRIHQTALAHQVNRIHQTALAHQVNRIHQTALAHQDV